MKKVLLVLSVAMAAIVMTSCFGRECACTMVTKEDGKKTEKDKSIVYKKAKHASDECKQMTDYQVEKSETIDGVKYEYEYKCK
ncbi:MAG: hypothetical protein J6V74_04965 [Bacteroidales bacterium]|nr:hypothetical protein [Bacteroidales bacterium]